MVVGPLGPEDLRRILVRIVPAISRPALRRIAGESGGNPLHAIELTRALEAGGEAGSGSLHATIARRLDRLPPELVPLLETAAALGRPSAPALAAAYPDGAAQLQAAVAEGVLVLGRGDEVRFEHPLVQSIVDERLAGERRRALHAHLATLAATPDQRVRHLARAVAEPNAAVAAEVAFAAERAAARSAYDLAAELAAHAVRLTPPDDLDALRDALAEIRAYAAAGEWRRGLAEADALIARLPACPGAGGGHHGARVPRGRRLPDGRALAGAGPRGRR